jgi:hypothetical protein
MIPGTTFVNSMIFGSFDVEEVFKSLFAVVIGSVFFAFFLFFFPVYQFVTNQ